MPFELEDIPQLISWVDSPELLLLWAGGFFDYPLDQEQCRNYWQTAQGNQSARLIFKAVDEFGDSLGHIELDGFDFENKSVFISRVLVGDLSSRGKGLGQAIVKQVAEKAFNQLGMHRLAVGVIDSNHKAIRCYENCGFQYEGRYRDLLLVGGVYYSVVTMSLLQEEWRG